MAAATAEPEVIEPSAAADQPTAVMPAVEVPAAESLTEVLVLATPGR